VQKQDNVEFAAVYEDITHHYKGRLGALADQLDDNPKGRSRALHHGRYIELSRELLRVERSTALDLRDEGRISDELLRRIERELDLGESKLAPAD
jgi:hypothetical protein